MQPGRGKSSYAIKKPMKQPYKRKIEEEEEEEESSSDPANKAMTKFIPEREAVDKKRERTVTKFVQRFGAKWRNLHFSDDFIKFLHQMHLVMQKNMDTTSVQVMHFATFCNFSYNRVVEDECQLFNFDLKRGQRTAKTDTLQTVSVNALLLFCDHVEGTEDGPFRYPVHEDSLTCQIYIEGCEWEEPQGFGALMRFVYETEVPDFDAKQMSYIRTTFLDILSNYFSGLCRELNRGFKPQNSYVEGEFITKCLDDHKK